MAHNVLNAYDPPRLTEHQRPVVHQQNVYSRNVDVQVPPVAWADLENDSEMWKIYLDEVTEEDVRITRAWKEDASSMVTFTGLLSAVIASFIIEFYKKLSSDQTVALLQQISHQLANSPNTATGNSNTAIPSPPGTAMVWVNALWLISLVLSLTCALIATLLQQWARIYYQTPKSMNTLRHRARVRSLLLFGTKLYNIPLIIEALPTLLHLSVYLFLGGLVIAFHTINETVAIAVDVAVGISGVAYIALSILPCLDVKCPYRTPISKILWYPCHALLSLAALCLHGCILGLHSLLNQPVLPRGQRVLFRWLRSRGFSASNHWRSLTDGLEKTITHRAVETLRTGDRGRITWLFNQLAVGDQQTFLKFAASIPRHKIPDFVPTIESVPFRESLLVLLRICVASRDTAWHNADIHERSLLVCLHAIRHIVKSKAPTIYDLNFMRAHLVNTRLMQPLWHDMDASIRIMSRSICALVARQVVRIQPRLRGEALSWLQEVTVESSNSILDAQVTTLDRMNFKSFVFGALPDNTPYLGLSTEDSTIFNETLAILLGERCDHEYFTAPAWQTRLSKEVEQIQQYDHQGGFEVFERLRSVFPSLPPITSARAVVPPSPLIPPREVPPRVVVPPRALPSPPQVPLRAASPLPLAIYPPPAIHPSRTAPRHHSRT